MSINTIQLDGNLEGLITQLEKNPESKEVWESINYYVEDVARKEEPTLIDCLKIHALASRVGHIVEKRGKQQQEFTQKIKSIVEKQL